MTITDTCIDHDLLAEPRGGTVGGVRERSRARGQAGFTLIEVMVALLLTVVAVIGIVALYMVETRASGFSRHEGEASVLAQDKMEVLRTTLAAAGSGSDTTLDAEAKVGAGIYTREWQITAGTGYMDYTVKVTWNEDGIVRSVQEYSRL